MPLKVGGERFRFVVSLHRSDAQKALLEGDKERFQRLNTIPVFTRRSRRSRSWNSSGFRSTTAIPRSGQSTGPSPTSRRPLRRGNFETINTCSIALYANHLGFEVSGHDPRKDNAADQTQREDAMVRTIANSLTDAHLTIVLVGTHHVAKLHEELEYRANTFTFAMLNKAMPGDTDTVKRASYLLSTPEIVKVNPGSALLETAPPLDAVNFINHELG